jgi:cysteine sulfinate desulfinase/cysteine desulfurase-like protein
VTFNGDEEGGMDNILNLSFAAVEGESLLMSLSGIALSSGSACTSASLEPSYVLRGKASSKEQKFNERSYWQRCGPSSQFNSIRSRPIHD